MSESQTWNHHMTSYENDDSNNRNLSFRLKHATLSDCLISISILFQTLGAATEKARDAIFVRHLGMLTLGRPGGGLMQPPPSVFPL